MRKHILKCFGGSLRNEDRGAWLLLHKHGEYEYRNPDSVYVHTYNTFSTRDEAIDYLIERVAPAEREEWRLYEDVSVDPSKIAANRGGDRMDTWADVG